MSRFPALRTVPLIKDASGPVIAGFGTVVLLVPAIGIVCAMIVWLLAALGAPQHIVDVMVFPAIIFGYSFVYTAPMMVVALPCALLALRYGYAGWGVAAGAGGLVTFIAAVAIVGEISLGLSAYFLVGAFFGGIFWGGARFFASRSLAWPKTPPRK